jgi:hypothetical protein
MCVPEWTLKLTVLEFAESPESIDRYLVISIRGVPGKSGEVVDNGYDRQISIINRQ